MDLRSNDYPLIMIAPYLLRDIMRNLWIVFLFSIVSTNSFAEDLGKKTYDAACQNCHTPKLAKAINAPPAFNKEAWDARFKTASLEAQKNPTRYKSAIDYLLYHVTIGKGLMHHGGLCNESPAKDKDCSNDALIDAIYYMSQHYPK